MKKVYYLVCSHGRSGTNLLCYLLGSLLLGYPGEMPNHTYDDHKNPLELKTKKAYDNELTYHGRTIWVKQMRTLFPKLRRFSGVDESIPDSELLEHLYPGIKYIYLSRREKLLQAISMWKANQLYKIANDPIHPIPDLFPCRRRRQDINRYPDICPTYDFMQIADRLQRIMVSAAYWPRFFEEMGIIPLQVSYEGLVSDKVGTLRKIALFLGAPADHCDSITSDFVEKALLRSSAPVKMADAITDEWASLFREEFQNILDGKKSLSKGESRRLNKLFNTTFSNL